MAKTPYLNLTTRGPLAYETDERDMCNANFYLLDLAIGLLQTQVNALLVTNPNALSSGPTLDCGSF